MANYQSYKKIDGGSAILSNSITATQTTGLAEGKAFQFYVYDTDITTVNNGGRCCLWTVPAGTTMIRFEATGGGGSGSIGACCSNGIPGGTGAYAVKTLCASGGQFTPGSTQYTICAGGSTRCSCCRQCTACACCGVRGCRSFVSGSSMSNFCAEGGSHGWHQCTGGCHSCSQQRQWVNACWGTCACFRDADFGIMGNQASRQNNNECRGDWWQYSASTVGPWGGGAGQKGTDQCTGSPWFQGCCLGHPVFPGGGGFAPFTDGSCCWGGWGYGGLVVVSYWQ